MPGPDTASEKGGADKKVRMCFATFANVVPHYRYFKCGTILAAAAILFAYVIRLHSLMASKMAAATKNMPNLKSLMVGSL